MGNWKIEILKIFKFNGYKKISHSRSNLFSNTLKKQSKIINEQNQLDDCKVKILENQSEFDILTKDSVWNIEKWALWKRKNKRNNILITSHKKIFYN